MYYRFRAHSLGFKYIPRSCKEVTLSSARTMYIALKTILYLALKKNRGDGQIYILGQSTVATATSVPCAIMPLMTLGATCCVMLPHNGVQANSTSTRSSRFRYSKMRVHTSPGTSDT